MKRKCLQIRCGKGNNDTSNPGGKGWLVVLMVVLAVVLTGIGGIGLWLSRGLDNQPGDRVASKPVPIVTTTATPLSPTSTAIIPPTSTAVGAGDPDVTTLPPAMVEISGGTFVIGNKPTTVGLFPR